MFSPAWIEFWSLSRVECTLKKLACLKLFEYCFFASLHNLQVLALGLTSLLGNVPMLGDTDEADNDCGSKSYAGHTGYCCALCFYCVVVANPLHVWSSPKSSSIDRSVG